MYQKKHLTKRESKMCNCLGEPDSRQHMCTHVSAALMSVVGEVPLACLAFAKEIELAAERVVGKIPGNAHGIACLADITTECDTEGQPCRLKIHKANKPTPSHQ